MGYLTDFELAFSHTDGRQVEKEVHDAVKQKLEALSKYKFYEARAGRLSLNSAKFYERDECMLELSKLFPDVLFQMDGTGEGGDVGIDGIDIWRIYYLNGKSQDATPKITLEYPEFNIDSLS